MEHRERGKIELGTKTRREKGGCSEAREEAGESDVVNFILTQQILSKNQLCAGFFLGTGLEATQRQLSQTLLGRSFCPSRV